MAPPAPFELGVYDSKEPLRYPPSATSHSSNNLSATWPHGVSNLSSPSYSNREYGQISPLMRSSSTWTNLVDGFKRDPHAAVNPNVLSSSHGGSRASVGSKAHQLRSQGFDAENAAQATAASPLARSLKGRHLQMIAIGGSIGTGLFVGSGSALSTGGPASLVLAFCLIGIMLYCTVQALGEMAVLFPVAGSFSAYSTRFLDPAWGFAMGWNYALQWLVTLPLEIVSACYTVSFWDGGRAHNAVWVILFLVLIISINICGVKGYGEAEFFFSTIKVIAVIGFIVLGIILVIAGAPDGSMIGGRYWHHPGAFHNGFKGLCSVFTTAAFAFGGTELIGLAAAETANPRKSLPRAVKQVFWRITLFYVVSLTLVGLTVPYTNPRLINADSAADAKASPFVIAIDQAGIAVLPSVFNAVILIAVISVGNSAVFGSSRTLAALSDQHQAPHVFSYIDRKGRPLVTIAIASVMGFLAFFAGSEKQQQAFDWMIALSGLSSIFTWGSICLAHIRFRRAWRLSGRTLDDLPFRSQPGVFGSWVGFLFNCTVLIAQFWTGFAPIGYAELSVRERVESWFKVYLACPFVLCCYLVYKIRYRTKVLNCRDMDLNTGMREIDISQLMKQEREEIAQWSRPKKIYSFFC